MSNLATHHQEGKKRFFLLIYIQMLFVIIHSEIYPVQIVVLRITESLSGLFKLIMASDKMDFAWYEES